LIVTLSQILFLSLGYYLGLSILTVVLCLLFLIVTLSQILFLSLGRDLGLSILTLVLRLARKEMTHLIIMTLY
jgi:hypothetical protein